MSSILALSGSDKQDKKVVQESPAVEAEVSAEPPAPGSGSRGRRGPIKITVNLLARTMNRLEEVCDWTGESKTDAINRAIQLYALYYDVVRKGESFRVVSPDGSQRDIHIL